MNGDGAALLSVQALVSGYGGVRILNQAPPAPFRESLKVAEQNLYSRSRELVGDRNPREHEFAVQLRAMDANKSGAQLAWDLLRKHWSTANQKFGSR